MTLPISVASVIEIAAALEISEHEALALANAAKPLWDVLEPKVDAWGGSEFERVFPEAIKTILLHANGAPAFGGTT